MTSTLQMDWPKIRKLSLDEAQDMRMTAKDMVLAYQSKCEIDDAMSIDCRRLKAKLYHTQNLLSKLNHHIKTINKADTECKDSLRNQLKKEKAIKQGMVAEIKQLKDRIAELENAIR